MFANNNRKIKHYEKCFGGIAIDKGFIADDDLLVALAFQANENPNNRPHRLLGEVFFDMGLMTVTQVDEVLQEVLSKVP